jgi:hypothetical protein
MPRAHPVSNVVPADLALLPLIEEQLTLQDTFIPISIEFLS